MNKIPIQVLSDLHLEFYKTFPKIKPLAKYLFLAGDIGTIQSDYDSKTKNFLSYCSKNWEKTFYVMGNHEFYQKKEFTHKMISTEELENKYQDICNEFSNVYLLNNTYQEIIPGLNIYGTTLWTGNCGFPNNPSEIINDYNMIAIKGSKSNVLINENYINEKSLIQINLLKNYLDTNKSKTLIMTHFPPFRQGSSNPKYLSQPGYLTNYFSWNNIYSKLNCDQVIGWISGHTHWSYDILSDKIRFISNQAGYSNEYINGETGFETTKVFVFEY
jgi:predicted phosphohydrolase